MFKNIRWWWLVACLCASSVWAEGETGSRQRVALVIGNDQYVSANKLKNAVADARAMAVNLEKLGYQVLLAVNANREDMLKAVRIFKERLHPDDEGVFYYAGHGVAFKSENFLLPTDISGNTEDQVRDKAIPLQRILDDLSGQQVRFALAIIDACRNNPFSTNGRNFGASGLSPALPATGQMVIYSAGTAQQALDKLNEEDRNPNSVFTRVFLEEMMRPNVTITEVLHNVRDKVYQQSRAVKSEQTPALFDQAPGKFYFNPQPGMVVGGSVSDLQMKPENQAQWQEAMRAAFNQTASLEGTLSEQLSAWQQFLTIFAPNNPYTQEDEALRAQATQRRDAVEKQLLSTYLPDSNKPNPAAAPAGSDDEE